MLACGGSDEGKLIIEESSMQSHTCLLSAFTLSTAMAFGVAAT